MKKLYFGTAGIPLINTIKDELKSKTASGIKKVKSLDLDCLEIEFVRGNYLKKSSQEQLDEIKQLSIDEDIKLSIHAPYYINLNSQELEKIDASIDRIVDSLITGQQINSRIVVFHPAYFMKQDKKKVLEKVSTQLEILINKFNKLKTDNSKISVGLELTGKETQVGSLEDTLYFYDKLKEFDIIKPVFDFSHVHARYNGYFLSKQNITNFFKTFDSYNELLKDMHCHMSGIEYTTKGERKHLMLEESDFPYKKILTELKTRKATGTIICESPIPYLDAQVLKKYYNKL